MNKQILMRGLTSLGLMLVLGCIPIPHREESLRARPGICKAESADFIRDGVTRRSDVVLTLGEPDGRWYADRVLAYDWTTSKFTAVIVLVSAAPGGILVLPLDFPIRHSLLVQFDPQGVVKRHAVLVNSKHDLKQAWKPD